MPGGGRKAFYFEKEVSGMVRKWVLVPMFVIGLALGFLLGMILV